ncbi:hypothetical protein R3X25_03955 [Lutibacter sp. TH_r2]|uniref:hypothetical protein n=1 Tax=Lutibacter sp. TH_r2 TaxID=3082083 RepID=UPI002955C06B|nr:hypothetical protein [Lutibacter sp. TH_r2]MDV7186424.1 hypothetical protein [Lutibacter sp. TH_r2]
MKKNIVYILFFIGFISIAQQNPVTIEADTTSIRIGEQIQYKISVNELKNVLFSKLQLDSLGMVEVVEDIPVDTLKNRLEKRFLLTSFDSGQYVIPQQTIQINNQKYSTDSLLINVVSVKVDTTKQKMFEIKSIKREPKVFDDYKPLMWWLIPIFILIVLALYLIFRKKVKPLKPKVVIAPIQEAMQRLKELDEKDLVQQNKIKIYYSELTDIVRTYIEKDIKIPALESTTNELVETISDFNESSDLGISKETIKNLSKVLESADLVKFAKSKPIVEEIKGDRSLVEDILNNTQTAVDIKRKEKQAATGENNQTSEAFTNQPVKKKNTWFKYFLIILAIVVIGLGTLGYFGYKYVKQNYIGASTTEMLSKQWYTSSYGNPSITLESPEILEAKSFQLPENVSTVIGDFSLYTYGSLASDFNIAVTTTNFISGVESFDIEAGVEGALAEIEQRINSKITNIKKQPITINGIDGVKVTANFKAENQLVQKKMEYSLTILFFGDTKAMQQVLVAHLAKDKAASEVKERVINSVYINR